MSQTLCLICRTPAHFLGTRGDRFYQVTPHRADLWRCPGCGSGFQFPQPTRAQVAAFYPSGYWQESDSGHPGPLARAQNLYVNLMLRHDLLSWVKRMGLPAGARYLDIGCSRGDLLAQVRGLGFQVSGLESDPRAADFARRHFQLEIEEIAAEAWQPEAQSLHGISALHLLEHLLEPGAFLKACHRALKPQGVLLLRVPNFASWQARLMGRRWKGLEMPRHLFHFTPGSLQRLLDQAGFLIEQHSTWSLRDGPPCLSSSLFPAGEPTWQEIHHRPSPWKTWAYLGLTWSLSPLEFLASMLRAGAMITLIARKRTPA